MTCLARESCIVQAWVGLCVYFQAEIGRGRFRAEWGMEVRQKRQDSEFRSLLGPRGGCHSPCRGLPSGSLSPNPGFQRTWDHSSAQSKLTNFLFNISIARATMSYRSGYVDPHTLRGHSGDTTGFQVMNTTCHFQLQPKATKGDLTLGPLHESLTVPLFPPQPLLVHYLIHLHEELSL